MPTRDVTSMNGGRGIAKAGTIWSISSARLRLNLGSVARYHLEIRRLTCLARSSER
jgi:hypothetical protein